MDNGWIKLHRKIMDWEWIDDHKTYKLFTILLLLANHQETKWRGVIVKPGQVFTGRKKLATITHLSEQEVRTSLNKLKSTSCVTIKSTNKYSLITVNEWDQYQASNQQPNQQSTNNQPTTNHIQECKELKNEKKRDKTPSQINKEFFELKNKHEIWTSTIGKFPRLQSELHKFFDYWTEPNKSGTKVRWQTEKTFCVKRRLKKWLSNADNWTTVKEQLPPAMMREMPKSII